MDLPTGIREYRSVCACDSMPMCLCVYVCVYVYGYILKINKTTWKR